MNCNHATAQLLAKLGTELDEAAVARLTDGLGALAESHVQRLLLLLDELEAVSPRALRAAIEALAELQRRIGLDLAAAWLEVGLAVTESSGAAALKYFRESPLLLGLIEPDSARARVLTIALELAEADPNVAIEFLRVAPEAVPVLSADQLSSWADVGLELAGVDYVLAIEYLRRMAAVARVLPIEHVCSWVRFGKNLVTTNSLGKPDYLGTLEFLRTSPSILAGLDHVAVRGALLQMGAEMAVRSPKAAIACLAEAPSLLHRLPNSDWQLRVLRYGTLLAERDAEAALAFVRRCPEVLALLGAGVSPVGREGREAGKFDEWFKTGMEILGYSVEGARAYFAVETHKALASIEHALSGVPLRQVSRTLTLFTQALCGTDVRIETLPDSLEATSQPARPTVSADGRTIMLPSLLRRYPTYEENVRFYLAMTAHEAGHLEFGTYAVPLHELRELVADLNERYRGSSRRQPENLADIFSLYPQPGLIRDLWTILEDARVEWQLRREYPGLSRDLAQLARDAVQTRTITHGLTVREMVVDSLLLLTTAEPGTVPIPVAITDTVEELWALCRTIFTEAAQAADTIRLAHRVYVRLEELIAGNVERLREESEHTDSQAMGAGPRASDEVTGNYRPVANWDYRGAMNPELVKEAMAEVDQEGQAVQPPTGDHGAGLAGAPGASPSRAGTVRGFEASDEGLGPGRKQPSVVDEILAVDDSRARRREELTQGGLAYRYPEWDWTLQDYRAGWCRLVERPAPDGSPEFAEQTLSSYHSTVLLLRRYFESLRPPRLRRASGQMDGEELDMDAAVRRVADLRAGVDPSERIYVRREKRERNVAVAFLVDVSGSTSRQIGQGLRVIDVERQGLVLLCEALGAIGDQYGIFGYSGQGKEQVEFLVIKDFDDPIGGRTAHRLGGLAPLQQNRDGAVIRHATRKLLARDARTRLLVLISDGRPLDDGYKDDYSLEDTKMALREAGMKGVDAFCITIDREADLYVRRMYGDVRFLVIDQVDRLPERLPRIYQRLTA